MEKVMDADLGGAIIGISAFLSMFVVAYFCRRKTPDITPQLPDPVVTQEEPEDPGDPQMLR
jgi:hypothetical protein